MGLNICRSAILRKRQQQWARKVRSQRFRLSLERLETRAVFHVGDHSGDISVLPGFYLDPALEDIQPSPPGPDTGPTPGGAPAYTTLSNGMPVLNSLLTAPTSIYLDFDGDLSGSNPYGDHTVSPYSEDADGTTFNVSEQRNIYEAWREISSYFAIFDTNVTTIMPASTQPKAWLAVGNNISGGYSYVGVFPNNTAPKSWNNSGDARTRVSGIAHELGHNFGLQHQATYDQWGNKTAEYASATDSLHGPIMGIDYSGIIHKFLMGHNSTSTGVTTLQDDIAIIASKIKTYQAAGGDGFRADDFGNTIATASALPVSGAAQWTSAMIERMTDVDAFSFTSLGGAYALSAAPDTPSGVDLKLEVYATDGSLIAANDGLNNVQELSLNLPAGTYYALVSSHGNYGDLGRYFMSVSPLPAGWSSSDVGTGVSGYTVYDSATGTFTPVGTGAGLTSTSDGFQYAYQILNGDGSITARVANVDNTSANALSGVTIRENLAANARHFSVAYTNAGLPKSFYRSTLGGSTVTTSGSGASSRWVRLVRAGNTFTSYTSIDGSTWTQLGTATTVSMPTTVTVGLLTASNNNHAMNVGQLDNVSVTGNLGATTPSYNSLAAPTGLTPALGTGSGLNLTWSSVAGATGYAIDRSTDGVNYTQIATSATTSYSDANLTGSMRYFYRISATDASGRSIPSASSSIINRPSAISNFSITSPNATQLVLNWRETTGESGYRIERSLDSGATFSLLASVGTNVPSYTDSALTSGAVYQYRITPTSLLGDGVVSTTVSGSPRLSAVGPSVGTVATGSIAINWSDLTNESNYRVERSTDNVTFTSIATLAANTVTYTDSTVVSGSEYYYRVFGTTALTQSLIGSVAIAAAPSTTPPAAPWTSADIGTVAGPGTTSLSSGTFTMVSSGVDVTGTSDSFRLTSQPLAADGEIIARVATLENTGGSAKAGVMIRQSTAAGSANAFVYVTPSVVGFSYRSSTGGTTTVASTAALTAPQWVKLTRSGNNFTAAYSADGVTWTQLGTTVSIAMTGSVAVGLAATANSTTSLNTSTFSNVAVSVSSGIVVSAATPSSSTTEAGGTVSFNVSLTRAPTADVSIPVSSSDTTEGTPSVAQVVFTPSNWNTPQTVTVTGVNDSVDDGNIPYSIILGNAQSADLTYNQLNPNDVSLSNIDDDTAGFTVSSPSPTNTFENGSGTSFTVKLNSEPTADVVINLTSSDTTEGIVSPTSLTFSAANWNVAQVVTVSSVNDNIADGNVAYTIVLAAATSGDSLYNGMNPSDVALINVDDDSAGFTVSAPSSATTTEAGGNSTFTVRLNSEPTANVSIAVSSNDPTEGQVNLASLTFTPLNWNVEQTVTATGVNDSIADGNVAYSVVLAAASSSDINYNGLNPSDVALTNNDDDIAGFVVTTPSSATTTEAGGTSVFTVSLRSEPTANVTIGLGSSDLTEGSVSASSLLFTPSNWNVPQTITVTGVDDLLADGNIQYNIDWSAATSGDSVYSGTKPASLALTNLDNDQSGFLVSSPSGMMTTETGGQVTFTVKLQSQPTADVSLPIASTLVTEGIVSTSFLTFTPNDWYIAQTVTVTGVNDNVVDGNVPYQITIGPSSSGDIAYNGINLADINLTNQDNDTVGVAVSAASSTRTTEAGGAVTFTVQLTSQPTADVMIPVSSSDTTEGTASTNSLVFTSSNWNTPQTVTVTGINDNVDDGDIAYSVILAPASSFDNLFQAFNAADVILTNQDDDTAGLTIANQSGNSTTEVGGTVTFTVRLNSEPVAPVTLSIQSSNTAEGSVSPASLQFTAANWNATQLVTVTGVNDAIKDGNIAYTINVGVQLSSDSLYQALQPSKVNLTNLDNDSTTRFFVVNDSTADRTYEYSPDGASVEDYAINSGNTSPRGITTTAAADKVWVVDSNRKVFVYNNSGSILSSWTAGTIATNATVEGIATDGTNIWIVDAKADRVYYYPNGANQPNNTTLNAASSFALASGNTSPKDIVFGVNTDGRKYLWVVNDAATDRVYRYDWSSSTTAPSSVNWALNNSSNTSPTGIALDPSNATQDLWIVDSVTDRVFRYANGRNSTTSSPASSLAYVLAAANSNAQGIADPPPAVALPFDDVLASAEARTRSVSHQSKTLAVPSIQSLTAQTSQRVPGVDMPYRSARSLDLSMPVVVAKPNSVEAAAASRSTTAMTTSSAGTNGKSIEAVGRKSIASWNSTPRPAHAASHDAVFAEFAEE